ncbi:MAG: DUF4007 family protein [Shewanella sp.]
MNLEKCTLKFSGHQTFPLRYGWIYKIIQEVVSNHSISSQEGIEPQMTRMGVGKNMVLSIRHWIRALGLVKCTNKKNQTYELTELATLLFTSDGGRGGRKAYDAYLDNIGTIWLLHWLMQSPTDELNAGKWLFNIFNGLRVDKLQIAKDIQLLLSNHSKDVTEATLKKDIDCLFQMYSSKYHVVNLTEDSFASPFTELGLIIQVDAKTYLAELSNRPTLPVEVFAYAVIDFLQKYKTDNNERTISFDKLLTEPGSPGKVFRLTSSGLSDKLDKLEVLTNGQIAWTDTQGLRQLQYHFDDLQTITPACYLAKYYSKKG